MGHTVVVGLYRRQGVLPGAISKSIGLPAQDVVPRLVQLDGSDQNAGQVHPILKMTRLYTDSVRQRMDLPFLGARMLRIGTQEALCYEQPLCNGICMGGLHLFTPPGLLYLALPDLCCSTLTPYPWCRRAAI